MLDKLEFIESKYEDLGEKISDPDVIGNQDEWRKFVKEHSHLEPIVNKYKEYKKVQSGIAESKDMLKTSWTRTSKTWWKWSLKSFQKKRQASRKSLGY